jgi:DNA invertase Pin-like site-specific DNA recombinase
MLFFRWQSLTETCSLLTSDKIDTRKLSRDALKALRSQAMRIRQELGLPWREIARVMGLNTTTVFGWAQRYEAEGEAGLVSRKPGRSYL